MTEEVTGQDPQETEPNSAVQIESLRNEAAKHRVSKNEALKKLKIMETVLSAHQIDFNVNEASLDGLGIDNGAVIGEYEYTPPKPKRAEPVKIAADGPPALTLDDVKRMSPDDINKNWDTVQTLLLEGG